MPREKYDWYMPASVLNALWGSVMPKLAATVWKGDLTWPPSDAPEVEIRPGLKGYRLEGKSRRAFWNALVKVAFGDQDDPDGGDNYAALKDQLDKGRLDHGARLSAGQRAAHVVLQYFSKDPGVEGRVPLHVIRTEAYDFVLSEVGVDIFIPENPFKGNTEHGRIKVLQMYRFRATGTPPIALPGSPCTFGDMTESCDAPSGNDVLIPIPQLSAPTGAYQIQEDWARGQANDVTWWLAGSAYRGMMGALPRIIATNWFDRAVDKQYGPGEGAAFGPTNAFFATDLKRLLEERIETRLPEKMMVHVGVQPSPEPPVWRAHDVMITNEGFFFPDPGPPPSAEQILLAIEQGTAGNPVFTDSDTDI